MALRETKLEEILNKTKTVTLVANELHVSRKTIYKWLREFQNQNKGGDFQIKKTPQAHNKISDDIEKIIIREAENSPELGIVGLRNKLQEQDNLTLNPTTIYRILKRNNIRYSKSKNSSPVKSSQVVSIKSPEPSEQPLTPLPEEDTPTVPAIFENPTPLVTPSVEARETEEEKKVFSYNFVKRGNNAKVISTLLAFISLSLVSLLSLSGALSSGVVTSSPLNSVASYALLGEEAKAQIKPETKALLASIPVKVYCTISSLFLKEATAKCKTENSATASTLATTAQNPVISATGTIATTTPAKTVTSMEGKTKVQSAGKGNTTVTRYVDNYITKYVTVQGPAGPQGPMGPQGMQGLPGAGGAPWPITSFSGPSPSFTFASPQTPVVNLNNQTFLSPTLAGSVLTGTTIFSGPVNLTQGLHDSLGFIGNSGQVFSSTGTSTKWIDIVNGGGGNVASGTQVASTLYWDGVNWKENLSFLSSATSSTSLGSFVVVGTSTLATTTITKANISDLTSASGAITNLTTTNGSISSLITTSATTTNLYSSSASFGVLSATSSTIVNSTSTNGWFSSLLSALSASFTNLYSSNGNITNLTNNVLTTNSLTASNATSTNLYSTSATLGNASTTNLSATGATFTNTNTTGTATINNASTTNISGTGLTFTNGFFSNLVASLAGFTGLTATNATTTNAVITNATSTNLFSTNGTINNFFSTLANISGLIVGNSTTTNSIATNATSTNFFATNGVINSLISTLAAITGLNVTNSTTTNAVITNGSIASLLTTNATSSNLVSTNATSTNFFSTNGTINSLASTLATIAGLTTTNSTTTNAIITSATATNLYSTSASIGSLSAGSATFANSTTTNLTVVNLTARGTTVLATTTITDLASASGTIANLRATNGSIASLLTTNATSTNLFSTNSTSTNGFFSSLVATLANFTNLIVGNSTTTNSITTNATSTNFFATNGVVNSLISTLATISGLTATNSTTTNATTTNLFASNGTINTFFSTLASIAGLTVTNSTTTNAVITSATSTNLFSTNGTINSLLSTLATITGLTTTNSTTTNLVATNATSTNLYSSTGNIMNLTANSLTATNATSTNGFFSSLVATLANFTNLIVGNSTTTNAIITSATSTNLFANNGVINSLASTLATITGLNVTNSTTTNAVITNTLANTGTTTLATTTISNLTVSGQTNLTNASTTNLTVSGTLYATSFSGNTSSTNSSTTNLSVANSLYTSLMKGSVPFISDAGLLTQDNPNFFYDAVNGRLGLGTTTLSERLSIVGNIAMTGSIIPTADNTYTLGSLTKMWKDVYIGPGSLYVNGQKVVSTANNQDVVVSASPNQNISVQSHGTGNIELNPIDNADILLKGNVTLSTGKTFTQSGGVPVSFLNGISAGNLTVSGNTILATNTNGGISLTPNGNGGVYVTNGNFGIGTTNPTSPLTVIGASSLGGNVTATGTLVVVGTTTLATTTITNASITSLTSASGTIANLTSTNSTSTTGWFSSLLSALTASFTNLTATNATTTNATSTYLFANNGVINSLASTLATITGLNVTNSTTTNATSTNFFTSNLFATNGVITNATSTNGFFSSLVATVANFTGLTVANSTTTNATSTNLYSTSARFGTLFANSATSTNSFSTNATTTNLFTSALFGSNLPNCTDPTASKLLYNASTGQFSCGTDTGSSGTIATLNGSGSSSQFIATSNLDGYNLTIADLGGVHTLTMASDATHALPLIASSTNWNSFFSNPISYFVSTSPNLTFTSTSTLNFSTTPTFTSLTITGTSSLGNATATNLFATNLSATNSTAVNSTSTNFSATNGIITNATSTNGFFSSLVATLANFTNLIVGNSTTTNSITTNATSTNFFTTNGVVNSLLSTLATITGLTVTNSTTTNAIITSATSTNLFSTNGTINSLLSTLATITGLNVTNSTTTNATTTNLFANSGVINSLASTLATITGLNVTNSTTTNAVITNASITNLSSVNSTTTNLSLVNLTATGTTVLATTTITDLTVTGKTTLVNASSTGGISANAFYSTNASTTNLFANNATTTNFFSSLLSALTASFTNLVTTNSTTTNAIITSATSTNFFSTNGTINTFFSTLANIVGLTVTNSTTTNGIITNATSTNLYSSTGNITNLTNNILTTNSLTATNASTTNLTVASTTYFANNTGIWDANGNLGIGTTTPQAPIHAYKNGNSGLEILFENNFAGGGASAQFSVKTDSGKGLFKQYSNEFSSPSYLTSSTYIGAPNSLILQTDDAVATGGNGKILFFTGGYNANQERMRIDQNGNLGIGTSTPGSLLSVNGNSYFAGNIYATGTLTILGASTLATTTVSKLTVTDLTSASGTINNLTSTNSTTTNSFSSNSTSTNGFFSSLVATLANFTNLIVGNSTTTNAIITSATSTNLFANNGTINTFFSTLANISGLTVTNSTTTNAIITSATSTNLFSTNGTINSLLSTLATITGLTTTNSTTTNAVIANASTTNLSATGATLTNLYSTSATVGTLSAGSAIVTNASTTNMTLLGALYDSTNQLGGQGQILLATGTSTQWVATSSLGISGGIGAGVTGGAIGFATRWLTPTTLGLSSLLDDGNVTGINATTSTSTFLVQGKPGVNPFSVASSSGSSFFTILSNGNVGVGTTTPSQVFSVAGKSSMSDTLYLGGSNGASYTYSGSGSGIGLQNAITESGSVSAGIGVSNIITALGSTGGLPKSAYGIYNSGFASSSKSSVTGVYNTLTASTSVLTQTSTSIYGAYTSLSTSASSTGYGEYITANNTTTGGTQYGLYVNLNNANSTNYGVYINRGNSYFGDSIGVGTTTPTSLLSVASSTMTGTSGLFSVATTLPLFNILANGNVGIGTSTPTQKLVVEGSIEIANNNWYRVRDNSGSGVNILGLDSSNNVNIQTAWSQPALTILPTSFVGIGTTSPVAKLDVWGNLNIATGSAPTLFANTAIGNVGIGTNNPTAKLDIYDLTANNPRILIENSGTYGINLGLSGTLGYLGSNNATPLSLQTNGVSRMYFDTTGNVGIGTTNPGARLEVYNSAAGRQMNWNTASGNAAFIALQVGGLDKGYIQWNENDIGSTVGTAMIIDNAQGKLHLWDNTNTGLTISGGNLGIGTTTPGSKLSVNGDSYFAGNVYATGTVNILGQATFGNASTTNLSVASTAYFANNTGIWNASGNLGIGTTTPSTLLHVYSSTASAGQTIETQLATGYAYLSLKNPGNNSSPAFVGVERSTGGALLTGDTANALILSAGGTNPIQFGGNNNGQVNMTILNNGNVGIGTTTPQELLHLSKSGNSYLKVESTTNGNTGIKFTNTSGSTQFVLDSARNFAYNDITGGPTRFFISSGGNIGIGDFAATTKAKLDVAGSLAVGYLTSDSFTAPSNGAVISGNVGIGTSTPITKLDISQNTANSTEYAYPTLRVINPSTATFSFSEMQVSANNNAVKGIFVTDGLGNGSAIGTQGSYIGTRTNHPFALVTNEVSRLFITNNGNIGVGTTSPAGGYKLETVGSILSSGANSGLAIAPRDSSGNVWTQYNNTGTLYFYNGSNQMAMNSVGNLGIGTTSPSQRLDVWGNLNIATGSVPALFANTATGNVGIGTSSPTYPLDVVGGIKVSGSSSGINIFPNGAGQSLVNFYNSSGLNIDSYNSYADGNFYLNHISGTGRIDFRTTGSYTSRLAIDSATGNVGIGTTNPQGTLHIQRSSPGNLIYANDGISAGLTVSTNGGFGTYLDAQSSAGYFAFTHNAGATELMRITSAGNVGLGTTTPQAGLDVANGRVRVGSAGSNPVTGAGLEMYYAGGVSGMLAIDRGLGTYQDMGFGVSNNQLYLKSTGVSYFGQGNVGVGVTAPATKLQVDAGSTANGGYGLSFSNGTMGSAWRIINPGVDNTTQFGTVNNNDLSLMTVNAERMRITTGGNVGIGTTAPGSALNVVGNIVAQRQATGDYSGIILNTGTTATPKVTFQAGDNSTRFSITASTTGITANDTLNFGATSATNFLTLTGAGYIGVGTTNPQELLSVSGGNINIDYNSATPRYIQRTFATQHAVGNRGASLGLGIADGAGFIGMSVVDAAAASGSFNSQYIAFTTHEGGVSAGERMRMTSIGNIGIGTTSPSAKLGITGTGATTGLTFQTTDSSNNETFFIKDGGSIGVRYYPLTIGMSSAQTPITGARLQVVGTGVTTVIDSVGNLGIGTTSPTHLLQINDSGASNSYLQITNSATGGNLGHGVLFGLDSSGNTQIYNQENSDIKFYNSNIGYAMTIKNSGNIGIGTTTPASKLSVLGNQSIGATYAGIAAPTSGLIVEGNVGIGTTNPISKLAVLGSDGGTTQAITLGTAASSYWQISALAYNATKGKYDLKIGDNSFGAGDILLAPINGNVGIGTTSPSTLLHVYKAGTSIVRIDAPVANQTELNFAKDNTAKWSLYQPASSADLRVYDWASVGDMFTFKSGGNVGIGTTSPQERLDVNGRGLFYNLQGGGSVPATAQTRSAAEFLLGSNSLITLGETVATNGNPTITFYRTSAGARSGDAFRLDTTNTSANFAWGTPSTAYGSESYSTKMTILSGGNVGIGTTNPQSKLDVSELTGSGIVTVANLVESSTGALAPQNTGPRLVFNVGWNSGGSRVTTGGIYSQAQDFNADTGGQLRFQTSNTSGVLTDAMTINKLGNVGIGTAAPGAKLHVVNPTGNGGLAGLIRNEDATNGYGLAIESEGTATTRYALILRNLAQNVVYGGVSTVTGQVGYWGIGVTPTGTLGSRLTVNGGASIGSGYTATAAPTDGLIVQGNLGVGTTSPTGGYKMEVVGSALSSGANAGFAIAPRDGSGSSWTQYNNSGNLYFYNGSNQMVINSSGNVGIGTSNPQSNLHVVTTNAVSAFTGTTRLNELLQTSSPNNSTSYYTGLDFGDGFYSTNSLARIGMKAVNGVGTYLQFGTTNSWASGVNNTAMTIDPIGNVGVGTTTPGQKLSVIGDIRATGLVQALQNGGSNYIFTMDAGNTSGPRLQLGDLNTLNGFFELGAYNSQNNFDSKYRDLQFFGNGISGIIMKATTGNIGIGTTSPVAKLDVWGNLNIATGTIPTFFANTATGNVGIGTVTPSSALEIGSGQIKVPVGTASTPGYSFSGNSTTGLNLGSDGGLSFNLSGTAVLAVYASSWRFPASVTMTDSGTGNKFLSFTSGNAVGNSTTNSLDIKNAASGAAPQLSVKGGTDTNISLNIASLGTGSVNVTNGNLGVGTTSPVAKLDVWGDINVGVASTPTFFVSTASGRAGIGTNSPSYALDVRGTGGFSGDLNVVKSSPNLNLNATAGEPLINFIHTTGGNFQMGPVGGNNFVFKNYEVTGATWEFQNSDATVISHLATAGSYIKSNLGIGTTTPSKPFTVYSSTNVSGLFGDNTAALGMGQLSSTGFLQAYTNTTASGIANLSLQPSGGNVGIGTTTPTRPLSIVGASAVSVGVLSFLNTGSPTKDWTAGPDSNGNFVVFNGAATGMYMTHGATSWTASSDRRLKENIVTIPNALNSIMHMRGVEYNFIGNTHQEIGVIAQEVQPYFPQLVTTGNPYLGVTYDRIAPILIEGIKDIGSRISMTDAPTSTPSIFIDTTGNIGIGTSTSNFKLAVDGNINFTGNLYQNGILFTSGISSDYASSTFVSFAYGTSTFATLGYASSSINNLSGKVDASFAIASSSITNLSSQLSTNFNQASSSIASLSNLVINNQVVASTTISSLSHLIANNEAQASTTIASLFATVSANQATFSTTTVNIFNLLGNLDQRTSFIASATTSPILHIDMAGNIGLGTAHPLVMLHVANTTATGTLARFENKAGYCDIDTTTKSLVCTTDDSLRTNMYLIDSTSTFATSTAGVIATTASSSLEKLTALHVVTYSLTNNGERKTGLVLSDIQDLFPDLVKVDQNGLASLSLTNFIPYIIESIKSLAQNVTTLALQIAQFKNSVTTNELCIGTDTNKTCLTKAQVDQILLMQSASTASASTGSSPSVTGGSTTSTSTTSTSTPASTSTTTATSTSSTASTTPILPSSGTSSSTPTITTITPIAVATTTTPTITSSTTTATTTP